jgi:prevent-host-death family protein
MSQVGIRALKQNASAVVAEAVAGESVTITDRGRPVALLTPIPASALAQLLSAGRARPPRRRLSDLPAPDAGPALSQALAAMRNEDDR